MGNKISHTQFLHSALNADPDKEIEYVIPPKKSEQSVIKNNVIYVLKDLVDDDAINLPRYQNKSTTMTRNMIRQ